MAKKKLATVRKGIRYQDLVAAEALLDLLLPANQNPASWVKLECKDAGKFDDVVIGYPGRQIWKQVKWAANPGADPLTIAEFSKTSSNRKTSWISGYVKSWQTAKASGLDLELHFVTNRSADAEIQKLLTGRHSKIKTALTRAQETRLENWRNVTNLNKTAFKTFRRSISFMVSQPDIATQTKLVRARLTALGGNDNDFQNLLEAIEEWSVDEKTDQITAEMVQERLKLAFTLPPSQFQLVSDITSREELNGEIARRIERMRSGYIVLLGKPGSGKSTALNTFDRDIVSAEFRHHTIIYNCFTGTGDNFLSTRAKHDNFVKFLTQQIRGISLTNLLRTPDDNLEQLLQVASNSLEENKKLVVFIDGLDYAKTFARPGQSNLIDSLPANLPANVIFVVSAQVAAQLPTHLHSIAINEGIHVPNLTLSNICDLIEKHRVLDSGSDERSVEDLGRKIKSMSSGHALYVGYILRAIKNQIENGTSVDKAMSALPPFDEDVAKYYEKLFTVVFASSLLRHSVGMMASCPFQLSYAEIAGLLSPTESPRKVEDEIEKCKFLFETAGGFLQFGHDSLRVFALRNLSLPTLTLDQQRDFVLQLKEDPRPGEYLLPILVEIAEGKDELDKIDIDWVIDSIVYGSNIWLIHEGLKAVAQKFLKDQELQRMAKFWCLMGCLERAEESFELNEATMIRAWLDTGQIGLIERYLFLGSQFFSKIYPSDQAIELLEEYGEKAMAAKLREKSLTEPVPRITGSIHDFEFEEHVRNIAGNVSPTEIVSAVKKRFAEFQIKNARPPIGVEATSVEKYTRLAAERCLELGEFSRVEEWLALEGSELPDAYKWNLWLRLHLAKNDLAGCEKQRAETAITRTDNLGLLIEAVKQNAFTSNVAERFDDFLPPCILKSGLQWHEMREARTHVFQFYQQVWLAKKLGKTVRLAGLKSGAKFHSCRKSRTFLELIFNVACFEANESNDWKAPMRFFTDSLNEMKIGRWNSGDADLEICSAVANDLGYYLRPLIRSACNQHEGLELEKVIGDELMPALRNRFLYNGTILGICDQLLLAECCEPLTKELLELLEKRNNESHEFKSGGFLSLAQRLKKLGDITSAKRVVRKGIAACFSYGYRKDTTINHFIDAFDAIIPRLPEAEVREIATFITQVLVLLDELTDLAMLHGAPTYFVVFLAKNGYDDLAVSVVETIRSKCRSMRCEPIAQAASEENVDIETLSKKLIKKMPNIDIGTFDPEIHPRTYFVSPPSVRKGNAELVDLCENEIASSRYCSAFWELNGIIRSLLHGERTDEAISLFFEMYTAIKVLVSPYPMENVGFDSQ